MNPLRATALVDEDLDPDASAKAAPFVVELVAHDRRRGRGYLGDAGALVPLTRARTVTTEAEAAAVAGETTADGDGLVVAFVRRRAR